MPIVGEGSGVSAAAARRRKREEAKRRREAAARARAAARAAAQRTSRPGHHAPRDSGPSHTATKAARSKARATKRKQRVSRPAHHAPRNRLPFTPSRIEREPRLPVGRNFRPSQMGFSPVDEFFTGLAGNFVREGAEIARGTPSTFKTVFEAGARDAMNLTESAMHGFDPHRPRKFSEDKSYIKEDIIDPQVDYYRERYVDPYRERGFLGGTAEVAREFYERPLTGSLDLWAGGSVLAKGGSVLTGGRLRGLPEPRSLTYKGATVHPPVSPNRMTEMFQKLADDRRNKTGRTERKVTKTWARQTRANQERIRARAHKDMSRLRNPDGFHVIKERGLREAIYWEAQLPSDARGGSGLRAILNDVEQFHQDAGGRRLTKLGKTTDRLRRALDKIEKNPELNGALQSAKTLADDAERIYIEAGKLDPAIAAERKALMAERLGIEGASDIYVTHTSRAGRRSDERMSGSRVGGGPTQTPGNLTHKNELILYRQGRLRQDPQVIVEHWLRAQTFDFHNRTKKFLADVSDPIGPDGPNPGWVLVNPEGKATPKHWNDVEEGDPKMFRESVREYIRNYIAEPNTAEFEAMEAIEGVRQVDPKVVRQLFDTLVGPQGTRSSLRNISQGIDIANGLLKTSLIYANPGYIPANLAGNFAMGIIHQGPFLPRNLLRSGVMMKDRELYNMARAEAGQGPTMAIARTGDGASRKMNAVQNVEKRFAHMISGIPDNWPRVAAWIYEARKAGFKTRKDQKRLLTDDSPEMQIKRDQIRAFTQDAMVDFERLGPIEQGYLARVMFVWPWIRGAARWAYTTPRDRPVRSALGANQAQRDDEKNKKFRGDVQEFLSSGIPIGDNKFVPASRWSTLGVAQGILDVAAGGGVPGEYVNPLWDTIYRSANREVEYPSGPARLDSWQEALGENVKNLVPLYGFGPKESELYPDDDTWGGFLKRRVLVGPPVGINWDEARSRYREETGGKKTTADRAQPILDQMKKPKKRVEPRVTQAAKVAVQRYADLEDLLDKAEIPTGDYKMRLRITADYADDALPTNFRRVANNYEQQARREPSYAKTAYYRIRDMLFNDAFDVWENEAGVTLEY